MATSLRRSNRPRSRRPIQALEGEGDFAFLLRALKAVKRGDFSVRLPPARGRMEEIAEEFNEIIEHNENMARELKRISRVVGTEGRLEERFSVGPVRGSWAAAADSVNSLITNLARPTTEVARVLGQVAQGDLSQTMPLELEGRPVKGAFLHIARTVNAMVAQLAGFASEVSRVAREVGTEGKLGGQARVPGVAGIWKDLTDNVNFMALNLTSQVRNIAEVTTAVANGDLSRKITVEVKGEILQLKITINTMVEQLRSFASEVTRVAREVGTEGKLGGQARVEAVSGVWKDLTDNVNSMASNLTGQVRNIAEVTKAVAQGDLSKKITVDVQGEILELKDTVNIMVDQLNAFASEVSRVAREVGTEGKLGGQAKVPGIAGTWKDLTENVNSMASNLTGQVRNIAEVTTAVAKGDLSKKISVEVKGEMLALKKTVNTMVDQLNAFAAEVTRVARDVGIEGKLGGQAKVPGVAGVWKDLTNNVNFMASNLTGQVRNISEVTKAIAKGDLSKKITVRVKGELLELKNTINTMVDQLNAFASETSRVAREVGTEGKLGGQAKIKGVAGVWKDLTNNVNSMARNLRNQVRNIAEVNRAIASGDLSKKITIEASGEILQLKNTINNTVDLLNAFASEVSRVAREVGTEGKLGGQAQVKGVAGVWKDLTDNVNSMASNLTGQVRNIADVTKAVAQGDLSRKITVNVRGEILELKNTINIMVDQLNSFASEVSRVAREVGTEGKLGGQARVPGVAGVWKDLTDNVNFMASNLTSQVRNIADVTTAVANGDLSRKITVEVQGEILALKNTINTMVEQLRSFAAEVTRVAREVGYEGKLGGQAEVKGVAGVWKDLTSSVNFMAGSLTNQVRNIAEVTTAVAQGDLSKKITVDVRGEILELKRTVNTMVDQLRSFASEVTRVAREVGTEGKLGGQAEVKGVAGVWKDLTDNVNFMASNLTSQVRNIAEVTTAVARGRLSKKITVDVRGELLELKVTINTMVDQLNAFASEVTRVAREVGTEGKLGGQARVPGVAGVWKDLTDNVNSMASNLTGQVRNIAEVTTAVAKGDLSRKITVKVKGEILELKRTVNTMVDQLNSFASEVTRVAREVGTEGKLGGQAKVKGVAGVWKDLTDNVNGMAFNLTNQVRRIAKVVTAVANGNLKQKLPLEARGEIAALADTINDMIGTLATFADQVTTVAREVGVEGRLGGQARVPGATGIWRDLTDNVNQLAANLTTQVRAIAEVSTAVTKGDLTRSIAVQAEGEVAVLKDTINEMIRNLRETTGKSASEDWLKTNLARFGRMLQGERDLDAVSHRVLSELAPLVDSQFGAFYYLDENARPDPVLRLLAAYGAKDDDIAFEIRPGEGLVGQCAQDKRKILIEARHGHHVKFQWTGGEGAPSSIVVFPVPFEGDIKGVLQLASINRFSDVHLAFLEQLTETIGIVINTITSTNRTETLLTQSQSLARELQAKNDELEDKARLLSEQKKELEAKNREIDVARRSVEEKAEQLAMTSKYKSQFLANMSHELRTPLNSLLILARALSENTDRNLTDKQVEFCRTIYSAGRDLLALINDILDLSKIESGTISLDLDQIALADIRDYAERSFRQVAQENGLEFFVDLDPALPELITTDPKRLQQVLQNLLSNALKFTEKGSVSMRIYPTEEGWSSGHSGLSRARQVIAFTVADTGIGIPADKHKIIFEAFQQVDMTTSRKYGGTGLGLAISREIAELLGGEIMVASAPGQGSRFTLLLPQPYPGPAQPGATVSVTGPQLPETPPNGGDEEAEPDSSAPALAIIEPEGELAHTAVKAARAAGLRAAAFHRADPALAAARRRPPQGFIIDMAVTDRSGWWVLDQLQHEPRTMHLPVWLVLGPENADRALRNGAAGVLLEGLTPESVRRVGVDLQGRLLGEPSRLLVAGSEETARGIIELIDGSGVKIDVSHSGAEALADAARERYDCLLIAAGLPDMTDFELLATLRARSEQTSLPVIVHGPKRQDLEPAELPGPTLRTQEEGELLWRAAILLRRRWDDLAEGQKRLIKDLRRREPGLAGKRILVVDDDVRNIYALTSLLEQHRMIVQHAENGEAALKKLKKKEVDIALMDIMMPGMDGYQTIRAIRQDEGWKNLPIIALTAKAMKGDREKCLEAGASDYIPKPVETDQLISLLRVWLEK